MKRFETYRDIRRAAVIFGLPIAGFAGLMGSVILSLLVIIFSFHLILLLLLTLWNIALYIGLLKIKTIQGLLPASGGPNAITNKQVRLWD